ncbi:2TM domain-containing protein [Mycoplasmatota bacterium]|nr:2TM domain-containing protein [Mycoplasmatota bacterium]
MDKFDFSKKEFSEEELINLAKKRIKIKRELYSHIAAYVFVNAFLLFIYYFSSDFDFNFDVTFWPGWVLAGWGLGLLFHIFETIQELNFKYNANVINKEMEKIKKHIKPE